MKLFDDEKDLFLHDFSKPEGEANEQDGPAKPAGQEFSFEPETGSRDKKNGNRGRTWLIRFIAIVVCALALAIYVRYFIPHTSESKSRGYITVVEKRGIFFKTFEGEMVSETRLADTSKVYSRDLQFSIPSDSLGRLLQSYQSTGRPVVITTKKYYGTLPWRGATNTILTEITPQ